MVSLQAGVLTRARVLSEEERKAVEVREDATLRQLRMYLRDCLLSLLREKKFKPFRSEGADLISFGLSEDETYFILLLYRGLSGC